jgi:hypothetical protein
MKSYAINKDSLQESLHQALRHWQKPEIPHVKPITQLRLFNRLIAQAEYSTPKTATIVRQLIESALKVLQDRNEDAVYLLRERYLNDAGIKKLTRYFAISESQFYKLQSEAVTLLAEIILEQEQQAQDERQVTIEVRLEPLANQQLFGIDQLQRELQSVTMSPAAPWLITLEGLGGIGKTSLADQLVRALISESRFYDIAWVTARQQLFLPSTGLKILDGADGRPALTIESLTDSLLTQLASARPWALSLRDKELILSRLLKQQPYLVIVDNLETIIDYQSLLPSLSRLANPTKFLLTSRHSLRSHPDVFCLNLTELSQADTLTLLAHEAQVRGVTSLIQASPTQLDEIYQVVGGNPLALKLVIGQIQALPLSQVLSSLKGAQGRKITELYSYIYWQSWRALSDVARQALLALPVASPRGSPLDQLAAVSGLELTELGQALEELTGFSLVEVGGDLENRRYSIHRLTETFLLTEITQWPPSP